MDVTGDGIVDLLSGQYNPGHITLWEGTKNGFKPGVHVKQYGDPTKSNGQGLPPTHLSSNSYWNFSSAGFGDFNNDGLIDLFVGGSGGLRVAINEGSKEEPNFGRRQYLLDIEGKPLFVRDNSKDKAYGNRFKNPAGDMKTHMRPIDWDNDGVLDLIVTNGYYKKGMNAIDFFRGIKTDKGLRFEQRVPLFTGKDGQKAFPGSCPYVAIGDLNSDGIKDIVIGASIPTVNGYEIDDELSWGYADELGIETAGKDPGRTSIEDQLKWRKQSAESYKKRIEEGDTSAYLKEAYKETTSELSARDKEKMTQRHRGYIYVMYGKKNKTKAIAKKVNAKPMVKLFDLPEGKIVAGEGPVKMKVYASEKASWGTPVEIKVTFEMDEGWYLYAPTKINKDQGYIVTDFEVEAPEYFSAYGGKDMSMYVNEKGHDAWRNKATISQVFQGNFRKLGREGGEVIFKLKVTYQTCNHDGCLAPVTKEFDLKVKY